MRCVFRWVPVLALTLTAAAVGLAEEKQPITHDKDVIYGRKFGMALTLDVLKPAKANGKAVIFVVSGGWVSNPASFGPRFVQSVLDRGYTVFAVAHGSQPKFTIVEILPDLHRAVRFIRANATKYAIDP